MDCNKIHQIFDSCSKKKNAVPILGESSSSKKEETISEKFFTFFGCGPKTKPDSKKSNLDRNFD